MATASVTRAAYGGASGGSRILFSTPLSGELLSTAAPGGGTVVSQPSATYSTTAGTTTTLTGLTPGGTYRVQVRARDASGNTSDWSTELIVTTTTATTRTVAVGAVTTAQVTGLTPSSAYTAQVRARDAAGNWSAWSTPPVGFSTVATGPTVVAGRARPVVRSGTVLLDVTATPPGGETIASHSWAIIGGGAGSLTNAGTATPTYTAAGTGAGLVTIRDTVTASGGGSATADVVVSYGANIVAAENALTGTARATWDLSSPNFGGVATLQGFCDGYTINKSGTANFKIAQSDGAGWSAELFRLGYYGGDGARSYGTLTPDGTQTANSQSQPSPADADPDTTLLSVDCAAWATTLTWSPPAWAPSGVYVLRLNRTGGGASHIMFMVRDDARVADLMVMTADSTWNAYNAWGGMGGSQYSGNSLYFGTSVNQYDGDCAHYVSYNRPVVNRGACDAARSYGAVEWSTFFTAEYPMVRFLERNGVDAKYYGCIDAGGDSTGTQLTGNGSTRGGVKAGMFVGHNEYWSDAMRSGWETAKAAGVHVFSCAGNEVFWRLVGTATDSEGRPRTWECQKSTIGGRGNTRPQWTGTWRDPDGTGKGGNNPENTFTGTIFVVNGPDLRALVVPFAGGYSAQPMWRHTTVAALTTGQTYTSPGQILGFEWDTYGPAGVSTTAAGFLAAPHARARYCSTATYSVSSGLLLTDAGDEYLSAGTATHRLVMHPGGNGAITFGTGTVNWPLGLDNANTYQQGSDNVDIVLQQATVNVLTDMGCPSATIMSGLTQPTVVSWFSDATATLTATATLSTTPQRTALPAAALTGVAALSTTTNRVAQPVAALTGVAVLSTTTSRLASPTATLTGVAVLTAGGDRTALPGAALTGVAVFATTESGGGGSTATLTAMAVFTAGGDRVGVAGATLTGVVVLTSTTLPTRGAGAALTAVAVLTAAGTRTSVVGAALTAVTVLTAEAGVLPPTGGGAALTGVAVFTAGATQTRVGGAALTAVAVLTAGGAGMRSAGAALLAVAVFTAAVSANPPGIPFVTVETVGSVSTADTGRVAVTGDHS